MKKEYVYEVRIDQKILVFHSEIECKHGDTVMVDTKFGVKTGEVIGPGMAISDDSKMRFILACVPAQKIKSAHNMHEKDRLKALECKRDSLAEKIADILEKREREILYKLYASIDKEFGDAYIPYQSVLQAIDNEKEKHTRAIKN